MVKNTIIAAAFLGMSFDGFATSKHLTYYSTLDDDNAILSPVVGESGMRSAGTFVAGVEGNAIRIPEYTQAVSVSFSKGLPVGKGRIEFYARIDSGRTEFYDFGDPSFFGFYTQANELLSVLQYTANNGLGDSGLNLHFPGFPISASCSGWNVWMPYSSVIGNADPAAWHHYAVVWNTNGIANITGNPAMAVLFNDIVVLSRPISDVDQQSHVSGMQSINRLTLASGGIGRSPCSIDEFKVWDTDEPISTDPVPETPVIKPASGTAISGSSLTVSMTCASDGAIIHYTTDGSVPTANSPMYTGKFKVYERTTVKAIAFYDDGTTSEMSEAEYAKGWCGTPVITAPATFVGSKAKVAISCATEGVTIRYTTDGSEPNSHSAKYVQPFYVTESTTVKAYATRYEYVPSEIAALAITREWEIGDTMGKPDHSFETSGDAGFSRVDDLTSTRGESMKSGDVGDEQKSVLSTTVVGPGTLTFRWKTSCESTEEHDWDHAEFRVDGKVKAVLDGITGWAEVSQRIMGESQHTITWTYKKDDVESRGDDCLWVADYEWTSDYTATRTTGVSIPYAWLTAKCRDVVDEYDSYERVAKQTAANPKYTVEQCYVIGLDPESVTNEFTAVIEMRDNVPVVTWSPDLNAERDYKVWGKTSLDSEWQWPTNSLHRFFKVSVEMKK